MNWYIVQAYSGFEKKVVDSIKEELKKSPPDRDFEVFSFEDQLYEIIDSLDEIIHFNPTLNKEKN